MNPTHTKDNEFVGIEGSGASSIYWWLVMGQGGASSARSLLCVG